MTVADRQDRPARLDVRVVESAGWRALVVDLGAPHEVLSWAIVNGGRRRATSVAWGEGRRGGGGAAGGGPGVVGGPPPQAPGAPPRGVLSPPGGCRFPPATGA